MFTLHVALLLTSVVPSCAHCLVEGADTVLPASGELSCHFYPNPVQVGRRGGTNIHQ